MFPNYESYDYVIIGAGIGGMFTGALLARAGASVCILEKHYIPGGYGHSFRRGEYIFCSELHYLWNCGHDEAGGRFFRYLGLDSEISFNPLNPDGFDHLNFPSFHYKIVKGFDRNLNQLAKLFPNYKDGIKKYFETIEELNSQMLKLPLQTSSLSLISQPWKFHKVIRYHKWTTKKLFEKLDFPIQLQSILAGQSGNLLVPPDRASLLIHAGMVTGYDKGACVPTKSYQHMVDTLVSFIRSQPGCNVYLKSEVKQLITREDRIITACTKKQNNFRAENFIFNGDPKTIIQLLSNIPIPKLIAKKLDYTYSQSNFTMYLGLRGLSLENHGFGNWNVWHYADDDVNRAFDRQLLDGDMRNPSLFISTPTLHHKRESGIAPEGCDQMVVCTPCDYDSIKSIKSKSRRAYLAKKTEIAESILDQIETNYVPDIRDHIDLLVTGSPTTNERYVNALKGNAYGADLTPENIRLGKLGFQSHLDNLFFTGATAGVPSFAGGLHTSILLFEKLTGIKVE